MKYETPFHLFNSSGLWIGFCLANNLFDTDAVWRGWFPWEDSADAVDPGGNYLGTLMGDRLYHFQHKRNLRVSHYPGYPAIPVLPGPPQPVHKLSLPEGARDIELKYVLWRPFENAPHKSKAKTSNHRKQ